MRLQVVKPLTYATRRLQPGDVFDARSPKDRKLLLATKKVREVRETAAVPAPPPEVAAQVARQFPPANEMKALREEYARVIGRAPFNGWNADKLRELIAAAKAG